MIQARTFFDELKRKGVRLFAGVPDSLLKDFCAYITDNTDSRSHIITANEGNAVGLAAGHYLATGNVAVVYLQNSGLGNTVNPLLSLADKSVYGIPMMLIIGWRGEPGKKDEPQHSAQGPLTLPLLKTLDIPHAILPAHEKGVRATVARMYARAKKEQRPVAIVVRAGTFAPYALKKKNAVTYPLTREEALRECATSLPKNAVVVSTTGKLSRELFELRKSLGEGHKKDFLTVGSMGHASHIALGIALAQPKRPVYCFDGDGASLMHLGGWSVIGEVAPKNFKHVVFNNGAHDSVGGQPTAGFSIDFAAVARACAYRHVSSVSSKEALRKEMAQLKKVQGPAMVEIKIRLGGRHDLSRPSRTPKENKHDLMKYLKG